MSENDIAKEKNRGQLLQDLQAARARFESSPADPQKRFALADLLLQAGEFWEANEISGPLLEEGSASEFLSLIANLAYLLGDYSRAEKTLLRLIANQANDPAARARSEIKLMFTWYQTRQFAKAHNLFKGLESPPKLPIWQQMKSFGNQPPFQINWEEKKEESIPFLITDPLPIIELEIQGKRIYSLIDTGGDTLYLDDEYAAELKIEAAASVVGIFGGGKEGRIGFAKAKNLRLGGITLNPIPITIMPTQRWSKGFADGKYTIGAVIGTGILKQFLATIDYPAGRLLLRPRTSAGKRDWKDSHQGSDITEIPFVLWQTHHMLAKGSLNEYERLTYFVDSGLASPAALVVPAQTLQYVGIPLPETRMDEDGIGGGGEGLWAHGDFHVDRIGLGPLTKENVIGDYGTMTPETYWQKGFIQDGLISHQFLRDYRWTLDFDEMKYYFVKP